jgi:hypothetical protein
MTTHGLELGTLDLASTEAHDDGYTLTVLGAGASFGASQAKIREIVSMLADGNLVTYDSAGNRVATFDVLIKAADGVALQAGEVALRRELYRRNTVTWTPPADFSAPTVYEIVTSEMAPLFDDIDELRDRRKFRVTLTCAPFARSAEPVTIEALAAPPVTPTTATITNADTTAGFSASKTVWDTTTGPGGATTPVTVTDGGSYAQASASATYLSLKLTYTTSAVDMSATRYLSVEMSGSYVFNFMLTLNGVSGYHTPILTRTNAGGTKQYVFDTAGGSLTAFSAITGAGPVWGATVTITLDVHDISRTDTLPQVSARQSTRIIEVGGTERTPASIHVTAADGTDPLGGLVIVHTSPEDGSGYSPSLRRWRTTASAGTPAAEVSAMSGQKESISEVAGGFNAKVDTSALPEGGYVLMARVRSLGSETTPIYWSTSTIFPDATTQEGYTNGNVPYDFPDDEWQLIPLAALSLPSVRTSAGQVEISLQAIGTSQPIELDEAWLFRVDDDCALSIVATDAAHLWLDSPDVSSSVPRVWIGDSADVKVHPGDALQAMGNHVLSPNGTAAFTAALTDNPATDATFYRRWHSNAAE